MLADTLLADMDDEKEEDVNKKEEEDIDNEEEEVGNKVEDANDNEKENEDAITRMLPDKTGGCYATKNDHQKRARNGETCHHFLQEAEDQHTGVQALLDEDA